MFLSDLEIIGFKSFGLKTKFKFSEGITCLVGPNGCGKSNIVDALRWVLGEQKSNVLRSDNMENIIFNGTKHRKQSGLAEVVLTIENNKHLLPSEFESVSVARRINRNGDSKYLLNKANCRLKDINNLFMDTGMGPDSYSVIELKMVENLLSGRNEDRKNLLEEAAGITKYKVRRKESERKLKRVEEDLERVEDIVVEVRKNVNSLSRQAAKTRRYNKFTEELKDQEIQLYSIDINLFSEKLTTTISNKEELIKNIKLFQGELDEIIKEINNNNSNKNIHEDNNKNLRINISKIQAELSDSKQVLAVSEIKEKNLTRDISRFEQEKQSSINSDQRKEERIGEILLEIDIHQNESKNIEDNINSKKQISNIISQEIDTKRDKIDKINISINNIKNKISEINFKKKRHEENLRKANQRIDSFIQQIDTEKASFDKSNSIISELECKQKDLQSNKNNIQEEIERNTEKAEKITQNISEIKNKLNDNRINLNEKTRELSFWEGSIDKSSNSGFLLSNKLWNKGYSTLAENLSIDEKYNLAFQSVLNNFTDAILIDKLELAQNAAEILSINKKGKQTFILNQSSKSKAPVDNSKILGYISELPKVSDNLRSYLRNAYSNFAIVEKFEDGVELVNSGFFTKIVSLDGNIYTKNNEIIMGGKEKSKSDFGKIEKIEKIKAEIEKFTKIKSDLEVELNQQQNDLKIIDTSSLMTQIKDFDIQHSHNQRILENNKISFNKIQNKIELLNENIQNAQIEKESLEKEVISEDISELEETINNANKEISEAKLDLESKQKELNILSNEIQNINIEKVNINNKIQNLNNEKRNIEGSIQANKKRISRLENEFIKNKNDLNNVKENAKNSQILIENKSKELVKLKTESEVIVDKIRNLNLEIESQESIKVDKNNQLNKFNSSFHKHEIEETELKTKVESILINASEKYELNIDKLKEIKSEIEPTELRKTIKELKEKLAGIGSVNFMALEDFEKENQRLIFYETQIEDLTKAKNTIETTIKEINKTAEELLTSTFDQVRANFKELFHTLFNEEGECDIALEGDNPLDANLTIMAKPPGKKPHSIDMLSGGEKTLTAIALLFAIYLVKPSPFCILDEVDAPLDDNNIGRFVKLIKKFSNNTQFLVVTHNKKTMEAADNLYGITQQEEGLSKIVSVQLNRNN